MLSLEDWLSHKVAGNSLRLGKACFATEEWRRFTGREHYAKVSLRAEPAARFEFGSEPGAWSDEEDKRELEPYVLDGVVAELLLRNAAPPIIGVRVTVTATVVDRAASNGNAFFMVAKAATAALLQGPDGEQHGNYAQSDA